VELILVDADALSVVTHLEALFLRWFKSSALRDMNSFCLIYFV